MRQGRPEPTARENRYVQRSSPGRLHRSHGGRRSRARPQAQSRPLPVRHAGRGQLHRSNRGLPPPADSLCPGSARNLGGDDGGGMRRTHPVLRGMRLHHGNGGNQPGRRCRIRLPGAASPALHRRDLWGGRGSLDVDPEDRPRSHLLVLLQGHHLVASGAAGRPDRRGHRTFQTGETGPRLRRLPAGHELRPRGRDNLRGERGGLAPIVFRGRPRGHGRRHRQGAKAHDHSRAGGRAPACFRAVADPGGEAALRRHGDLQGQGSCSRGPPPLCRGHVRGLPGGDPRGPHDGAYATWCLRSGWTAWSCCRPGSTARPSWPSTPSGSATRPWASPTWWPRGRSLNCWKPWRGRYPRAPPGRRKRSATTGSRPCATWGPSGRGSPPPRCCSGPGRWRRGTPSSPPRRASTGG